MHTHGRRSRRRTHAFKSTCTHNMLICSFWFRERQQIKEKKRLRAAWVFSSGGGGSCWCCPRFITIICVCAAAFLCYVFYVICTGVCFISSTSVLLPRSVHNAQNKILSSAFYFKCTALVSLFYASSTHSARRRWDLGRARALVQKCDVHTHSRGEQILSARCWVFSDGKK
jgi:hypothetical protein